MTNDDRLPRFLRTIEDLETEDLDDLDLRKYALAEHLETDPDNITRGYYDFGFVVDSDMKRQGESPAYYQKLANEIRRILSDHLEVPETWESLIDLYKDNYGSMIDNKMESGDMSDSDRQDGVKISEETRRFFIIEKTPIYAYVYERLKGFMPDSYMHYYINGLYFLLYGPMSTIEQRVSWHIYAIRAAFNGEDIEDKRLIYRTNSGEYLVLTEEDADQKVREYIEDSLWSFSPVWLEGETGIDSEVFSKLSESCENGNDAVLALVNSTCGLDDLITAAIETDGRVHFLNTYDGHETEVTDLKGRYLLIYRTN